MASEMVLDSSAIVAIFKKEPGYEVLEGKIDRAETILIGASTVAEAAIVLSRQALKDQRALLEAYLRRIEARVVEFTEIHYSVAAEASVRYGRGFNPQANLNYGDCLAYAVAAVAGDTLLFAGGGFRRTDIPAA
jgi:ribonuclease VapC